MRDLKKKYEYNKLYRKSASGLAAIQKYKNSEKGQQTQNRFLESAKGKFVYHREKARQRGVEFLLSFDEWWLIWQDSGHWKDRGRKKGQYVMSRHGDIGPYANGNVSIVLCSQNSRENLERVKAVFKSKNPS